MNVVLANACVRTGDDTVPLADTIVIRDRKVEWVGFAEADPPVGDLPIIDLQGKTVMPGIVDSHTHPALVAMSRWHVRLPEAASVDELLDFIRRYGEEHPKEEHPYLYFEYYSTSLFADHPPTRQLLDTAVSDRPVLCQDAGDHASWVNTSMLEMLGVDRTTADPVPGLERFERDGNGDPTGYILENAHLHFLPAMYEAIGWSPPEKATPAEVAPVLDFLSSRGVVAVFDALIEDPTVVAAMRELDVLGALPVHYEGAVRFRSLVDLPEAIASVKQLDHEFGTPRVRVRTVKLFLDGTNELGSGAVIEPLVVEGGAGPRGAIQMEVDELVECLTLCNAADVDVHIHMVGDRAFRTACDAVEQAQRASTRGEMPWRIQITFAHCELIDPSDMARPAQLGVIINWTNHWSGGYFGDEAIRHLGEERWNRMYDFNTVADAGAVLAFSSDVVSSAELHRADPFLGMQIAATRVDPEVPLDMDRWPESRRPAHSAALTVERLFRGYTSDAARQLRIDESFGVIAAGRPAHLLVLNRDLFATPLTELGEVTPTAVLFEGRLVAGEL